MYIVKYAIRSLCVLVGIALVSFFVFQFIGDPVLALTSPDTTEADRLALRAMLGLDEPVVIQFLRYLGRAFTGDFGVSYVYKRPVFDILADRLPATLEIVFAAALASVLAALAAGTLVAARPKSPLSALVMAVSTVGVAVPTFLTAIGLIMFFSVWLGWLPSFGRGKVTSILGVDISLNTIDGLSHAVLPMLVLFLFQVGVLLRLVRGEMLEIMQTDFIRFCRARGLSRRSVYLRHALRNTLVPVVTAAGVQFSALLAFSVVVERVFQWPGIGQLFLQSVQSADIPVLSGYLLMVGLIFMTVNLLVDVSYFMLDPRTRRFQR